MLLLLDGVWRALRRSYRCSRVQLFLLPLKHHVVHLVFLELLLAAVQQQLPEVDGADGDRQVFGGLVSDGHFELDGRGRKGGDGKSINTSEGRQLRFHKYIFGSLHCRGEKL